MLWEFRDIFALTEEEVGLRHLVRHEIYTGDARPIKTRPRRLPLAHQAAADSAIEEMLRTGKIEPSDSLRHCHGKQEKEPKNEILYGLQTFK